MASGAEGLLEGKAQAAGVTGPLAAFGREGLEQMCRDVGLAELPR